MAIDDNELERSIQSMLRRAQKSGLDISDPGTAAGYPKRYFGRSTRPGELRLIVTSCNRRGIVRCSDPRQKPGIDLRSQEIRQ